MFLLEDVSDSQRKEHNREGKKGIYTHELHASRSPVTTIRCAEKPRQLAAVAFIPDGEASFQSCI